MLVIFGWRKKFGLLESVMEKVLASILFPFCLAGSIFKVEILRFQAASSWKYPKLFHKCRIPKRVFFMLKELTLLGKYDPRMDFCARASKKSPSRSDPLSFGPPKKP